MLDWLLTLCKLIRVHKILLIQWRWQENKHFIILLSLSLSPFSVSLSPSLSPLLCLSPFYFSLPSVSLFCKDLFSTFICLAFDRLLSVLRGHSVFSSPPQRPMTSDLEGFSIPDFMHYIYFPILIPEKEPVFYLLNVQC